MNWIDINQKTPTNEDLTKEFLVRIETASGVEFQVAEWWNYNEPHEEYFTENESFFNIEDSWCGQQIIAKKVTHYIQIIDI